MKRIRSVKTILGSLLLVSILFSCSKENDSEIKVKNEDLQEDTIVSQIKMEAFVQKVYIDLLGRKATSAEIQISYDKLNATDASFESRKEIVEGILGTDEYFDKLYLYNVAEYLNGVDQSEIEDARNTFIYIRELGKADNNQIQVEVAQAAINNLDSLLVIPTRLKSGAFSEDEMQKRVAFNAVYDEINMGVPNFTFAVFESFLFRAPTALEWENSQRICNNQGGVIFGVNGDSKIGFLDIVFSSDHYFEGKVLNAYLRFLNRKPTTVEQYQNTVELIKTKRFQDLYLTILSSEEYFGK